MGAFRKEGLLLGGKSTCDPLLPLNGEQRKRKMKSTTEATTKKVLDLLLREVGEKYGSLNPRLGRVTITVCKDCVYAVTTLSFKFSVGLTIEK